MRGFCSRCGREAGGLFRPRLWQCPRCRKVYCDGCTSDKKVGLIFKKPVCPECLLELVEGGVYGRRAEGWARRNLRLWSLGGHHPRRTPSALRACSSSRQVQ